MTYCKYPNLFSPIIIKGKTFKNRILVSPMGLGEPRMDGWMTEEGARFYELIAKGGSARICTGENDVLFGSAVFGIWDFFLEGPPKELYDSFRKFNALCHAQGALTFTSFDHNGVYTRTTTANPGFMEHKMAHAPYKADGTQYQIPDVAFGPVEMTIDEPPDGITSGRLNIDDANGRHVCEMTEDMMNEYADAFAHCAKVAKDCGLDGIVLHSGHGFLFSQWVSRRFNKRTDKYGGNAENKARFPIMVLKRIREAVGDDLIIEMRFSAEEDISIISDRSYLDELVNIEDTVAFFKELDKYPGLLDIAHITGGLHTVPFYNTRCTANSYFPMGVNVRGAAAVKAVVQNIKVGVVGSLSDPDLCEKVIAEGKADFVILCRQLLITDPEFPNKAASGKDYLIDNCLRCVVCRATGFCAANPREFMLGDKDPLIIRKSASPGKAVVVGGGIAGLKAAEYAAEAGHSVVLFEKSGRLGGILRYADYEPHKQDVKRFKDNMIKRLTENAQVDIRLNTVATPESVKAENADAAIIALGGIHASIGIPGEDGENVVDSVSAYMSPEKVGQNVVIIGGGLTGCEDAIHWAELGRDVTIISRAKELMRRVQPRNPADGSSDTHLIWLNKLKVKTQKGCAATRIVADGVYAKSEDGEVFVEADTVINASGILENPDASARFEGSAPYVCTIGDCTNAAQIGEAVLAAKKAIIEMTDNRNTR